MVRIPASKVREEFADTLNKVAFGRERVVLHRRGKDIAAIVPLEDYRRLVERDAADGASRPAVAASARMPISPK